MPKIHNYEEEYSQYDGWLDISNQTTYGQLVRKIETTFGLNPISAGHLADRLWIIKQRELGLIQDEEEIGLPPEQAEDLYEPPKQFSTKKGYRTITEWRIMARDEKHSEQYIRRIESYLRRYPQATLKEARGHA